MPALIFAARALVWRATLSHNGVELAPAFPLATVPGAYHRRPPLLAYVAAAPSPIFVRPLNYSGLGCVHFTSGRTTELF